MSDEADNDALLAKIRARLDDSIGQIDARTQSAITAARYRALEQQAGKSVRAKWLPAGALASVCVSLLLLFLLLPSTPEPAHVVEDLELLSNIDELELLEDLEFYEWLDEYDLPV